MLPSIPNATPTQNTHVRFADEQSVFYWTFICGCTELELRDAAAAIRSSAIEELRHYFNFVANPPKEA